MISWIAGSDFGNHKPNFILLEKQSIGKFSIRLVQAAFCWVKMMGRLVYEHHVGYWQQQNARDFGRSILRISEEMN